MASNAFALVRLPSDKDNKTIRIEWITVGTEVGIPQEQAGTVQSKLNWTGIGPYRDKNDADLCGNGLLSGLIMREDADRESW